MKLLCAGDLHLNDKPRDAYRHEFQKRLRLIARNERVDRIIVLGDLTEEKDHHSAWLVNKVVEHFKALAQIAPVTVLRGNHDYEDINSPFFEFLGKIEGIKWISNPDAAHLPGRLFLPHTRNYQRDWAKLDLKQFEWIFTHNTFEGAQGRNKTPLNGIPLSVIPEGPIVISGDIHAGQQLGPVTYVGAPYTVDFGDWYKPRLILVNGDKIESIPCKGPQKRLLHIAWPSEGADERVLDEALKKQVKEGDIAKFRVDLEPEMYDHWQSIYDVVKKWADKAMLEVSGITPEMMPGDDRKVTPTTRRNRGDVELMREYVKQQGADERTLKTGDNLRLGVK